LRSARRAFSSCAPAPTCRRCTRSSNRKRLTPTPVAGAKKRRRFHRMRTWARRQLHDGRGEPAGDVCAQRWTRRRVGLSQPRRDWPETRFIRGRRQQPLGSGDADRQPGHVARFQRSRLHRSSRYRFQPFAGLSRRHQARFLHDRERRSISLAHHLRLAVEEPAAAVTEVSRRRELRRLPRSADHPLPPGTARRCDERPRAGSTRSTC